MFSLINSDDVFIDPRFGKKLIIEILLLEDLKSTG